MLNINGVTNGNVPCGTRGIVDENNSNIPFVIWENGNNNPSGGGKMWCCKEDGMDLVKSVWTPKVGDLVKCVKISASYYTKPIIGNIYEVTSVYDGGGIEVNGDTSYKKNHIGCRFEWVDFELYEPIETIEEPKKTIEKIAVQCDTLDEWKAVLDKLFSERKRWLRGEPQNYRESDFIDGRNVIDTDYDGDIASDPITWYANVGGYTIIPAKEYLGAESSVKLTNPVTKESLIIPSTPKKWVGFEKILQESIEEYEEKSRLNKKPNKIKQMTNNIVEFAKNLTLSADEKLLREVGLHDDEGCYTEDALNIALNLESIEIGYKSYQDLCDSVPEGCPFSLLEAARLLKKYEVQLLDIAKKMKEESKTSKK